MFYHTDILTYVTFDVRNIPKIYCIHDYNYINIIDYKVGYRKINLKMMFSMFVCNDKSEGV